MMKPASGDNSSRAAALKQVEAQRAKWGGKPGRNGGGCYFMKWPPWVENFRTAWPDDEAFVHWLSLSLCFNEKLHSDEAWVAIALAGHPELVSDLVLAGLIAFPAKAAEVLEWWLKFPIGEYWQGQVEDSWLPVPILPAKAFIAAFRSGCERGRLWLCEREEWAKAASSLQIIMEGDMDNCFASLL